MPIHLNIGFVVVLKFTIEFTTQERVLEIKIENNVMLPTSHGVQLKPCASSSVKNLHVCIASQTTTNQKNVTERYKNERHLNTAKNLARVWSGGRGRLPGAAAAASTIAMFT